MLWWLARDPSLSERAGAKIADGQVEVLVSAASAWEISIKRATGKLKAPDDLTGALDFYDFLQLPISFEHAAVAGALPGHHRDPFDRMLVAQAQVEGVTLVTSDPRFEAYDIELLRA